MNLNEATLIMRILIHYLIKYFIKEIITKHWRATYMKYVEEKHKNSKTDTCINKFSKNSH